MAPLTKFVEKLREAYPDQEFPDFDPLDGGARAEILFLFEKPGPMTSARGKGSGFISRDNNDPTAKWTSRFMENAGLPRDSTVIWNVVPGWNGDRKITAAELRAGVEAFKGLVPLLPKLRVVVLVGKKAQRARPLIERFGLRILASAHPSQLVRNSRPDAWRAIPAIWAKAKNVERGDVSPEEVVEQ